MNSHRLAQTYNPNLIHRISQMPYREDPYMFHNAGQASHAKAKMKINTNDDNRGLFDGIPKDIGDGNKPSSVVSILTKYVTRKHADDVTVKMLIDQREMQDKIFENIFKKFAKGEKLDKYNEFK